VARRRKLNSCAAWIDKPVLAHLASCQPFQDIGTIISRTRARSICTCFVVSGPRECQQRGICGVTRHATVLMSLECPSVNCYARKLSHDSDAWETRLSSLSERGQGRIKWRWCRWRSCCFCWLVIWCTGLPASRSPEACWQCSCCTLWWEAGVSWRSSLLRYPETFGEYVLCQTIISLVTFLFVIPLCVLPKWLLQ